MYNDSTPIYIHCQFTIGEGQGDPKPTVVMGVVGPDDPVRQVISDAIQEIVRSKLAAGSPEEDHPVPRLGFHPNDPEDIGGVPC